MMTSTRAAFPSARDGDARELERRVLLLGSKAAKRPR